MGGEDGGGGLACECVWTALGCFVGVYDIFMIGVKGVCEGGCERGCEEKCEGQGIIGGDYESDKKCEGTNQP